jgi:hypothetical protein
VKSYSKTVFASALVLRFQDASRSSTHDADVNVADKARCRSLDPNIMDQSIFREPRAATNCWPRYSVLVDDLQEVWWIEEYRLAKAVQRSGKKPGVQVETELMKCEGKHGCGFCCDKSENRFGE